MMAIPIIFVGLFDQIRHVIINDYYIEIIIIISLTYAVIIIIDFMVKIIVIISFIMKLIIEFIAFRTTEQVIHYIFIIIQRPPKT